MTSRSKPETRQLDTKISSLVEKADFKRFMIDPVAFCSGPDKDVQKLALCLEKVNITDTTNAIKGKQKGRSNESKSLDDDDALVRQIANLEISPTMDEDSRLTAALITMLNKDVDKIIENSYSDHNFGLRITLRQRTVNKVSEKYFILQTEKKDRTKPNILCDIPVNEMSNCTTEFQRLNQLLIGNGENRVKNFCACGGNSHLYHVAKRAGLKRSINCKSSIVIYGLFCNHQGCKRIVYVGLSKAGVGKRMDGHSHTNGHFSKRHIADYHRRQSATKPFFIDNIIVVILHASDDVRTLRNWEVFWQSLLRAHVCFPEIQPPGCSYR